VVTDTPILFCPFCREAFEGLERCPTHDTALVGLRELGALAAASAYEDAALPWWSWRAARGWLASGALLTLLAFFCPLATLSGDIHATNSGWQLAHGRALRLWIVPTAAFALLLMLYRRRTGREMRGARLAALFVSILPSTVVIFTLLGARSAAERMAARMQADVQLQIGAGAWMIWLAAVLMIWGSLRFGVRPKPRIG
jgi:hypothetical protein